MPVRTADGGGNQAVKHCLVVAPEICSPWTEGRKNLVRDLCSALTRRGISVSLLTFWKRRADPTAIEQVRVIGTYRKTSASGLLFMLRSVSETIEALAPDVVLHFPYGSFKHMRGHANRLAMRVVDRSATAKRYTCATILYSADEHADLRRLSAMVSRLIVGPGTDDQLDQLEFGIDCQSWPTKHPDDGARRILFMAGMWQRTRSRLRHVMQRRGLELLLKAGEALRDTGARLRLAAPLFSDRSLAQAVLNHPDNSWPPSSIEITGQARIPDIYLDCDLFVFPYNVRIQSFRPTSVIEAMMSGIPAVVPDFPFMRNALGDAPVLWFAPGDPTALAQACRTVLGDPDRAAELGGSSARYARAHWSIEATTEQLLSLLER